MERHGPELTDKGRKAAKKSKYNRDAAKCGRGANAYTVEFLAPDNAQVEARGKVLVAGKGEPDTPSLSLDGKPCSTGRCAFLAKKGQTYKLTAESTAQALNELCISVARP